MTKQQLKKQLKENLQDVEKLTPILSGLIRCMIYDVDDVDLLDLDMELVVDYRGPNDEPNIYPVYGRKYKKPITLERVMKALKIRLKELDNKDMSEDEYYIYSLIQDTLSNIHYDWIMEEPLDKQSPDVIRTIAMLL